MAEQNLYKSVARFVKAEFGCFAVKTTKGTTYGSIDVIGLRYNVGDFGGTSEIVAVEVKPENSTFLKSLGQALAYSVMADRCYLAIHTPYRRTTLQDERELAAQLRVGLIEIGVRKMCRVVVSSPQHRPIRAHKLSLLNQLGFHECMICTTLLSKGEGMRSQGDRSGLLHAIRDGKAFRYWLYKLDEQRGGARTFVYDRRYFCKDCVAAFSTLAPRP
jgi:hypothetical protein